MTARDLDAPRRLAFISRVIPLPLLAAAVAMAALTVSSGVKSWHNFSLSSLIAGAAGIWIGLFAFRPEPTRPRTKAVRFTVHSCFAAVLVGFNPWYGIFGFTGYLLTDGLSKRGIRLAIVVTAFIMGASQLAGYPALRPIAIGTYLLIVSMNVAIALTFITITDRVMEQNSERGLMIDELAKTNAQLETAMAENAGLHAQLLHQAREAGILDERRRMAGEIHDTLAQSLMGIVTQLEAAQQARQLSENWQRHVGAAEQLARSGLHEARRSMHALRPEQLEQASLRRALAELVDRWSTNLGVAARFEVTGTERNLPAEIEAVVFRVAQEALTNVDKHADAGKVWLTLSYLDSVIAVDIRDDGLGFDPTLPRSRSDSPGFGGFGIAGMRQRVERESGTLTVESAAAEGTVISAAIPLPEVS